MGLTGTCPAQCLEWSLHPVDIGFSCSTILPQLCLPLGAERAKPAWGRSQRGEHPLSPGRTSKAIFLYLLSRGSVVVEHDVILKTKFIPDYKEFINKVAKKVEEKIKNATQEQTLNNDTCSSKFLGFWGGA